MREAVEMVRWAGRDFVFNLEAIPEDKLDWKPSPEAKSALQLAGEVATVAFSTISVLQGGGWSPTPLAVPADLAEARQLVLAHVEAFAAEMEATDPASLQRVLTLPFGSFRADRFVLFPLIDLVHHRGQLAYIQSLLGDAEVRFDPEASDRFFNPG
jgi:uncharacterized damage-inducible protein DinB